MRDRIDEIKARLAKATPGPWIPRDYNYDHPEKGMMHVWAIAHPVDEKIQQKIVNGDPLIQEIMTAVWAELVQ